MSIDKSSAKIDVEGLTNLIGTTKSIALIEIIKQVQSGRKISAHELSLLNDVEKKLKGNGQEEETRGRKINGSDRVFNNPLEVLDYLQAEGWKIAKSTIYNHVNEGKLRPDAGKKFTLNRVLKYAKTHLETEKTRQKKKIEEKQNKKIDLETEKLEEEIKEKKFKREIAEGKYILKENVYLELASRAAVLERGFKGMIQARAGEFVDLIDGDETKTGELVREMILEVDRTLNEFASIKEFQVMFEFKDESNTVEA